MVKFKLAFIGGCGLLFSGTTAYAACITNTSDSRTSTLSSSSNGDCIENNGTITTSSSYAISSTGQSARNTNNGTIITSGDFATGIFSGGWGVDASNTVNINNGTISTNGQNSHGIGNGGLSTNTDINNGLITINGDYSAGIYSNSFSSNDTITNNGTIRIYGQNGYGILSSGATNVITNSGAIYATGLDSVAIKINATNNTVNLNRGSVIVGDIYNADASGARLNINLGAGVSYAYSVTGTWTVTDLDNRPMVTGSAYAAGIGAQETAAEMLYQRTSAMTSAIDRRLQAYAADEVGLRSSWLDVYYADVTRDAGGNYSTQTAFSNYNYGATAGFQLSNERMPLELLVNVAQSNLNIDSGSQKVNSTSLMVGVLAPKVTELLGSQLSAKVMLGYADHDGDRKVMTNSLLYDGSRQIQSDYQSTYAVLGTALTKLYPITDHLTADVLVGLDLNAQWIESYQESDYFAWDGRTLTQLQSRIQSGLNYRFNENKANVFARVGAEHRGVIGGAGQGYSMNGSHVSFNSNNKTDTYLTAQLGLEAQLEKRIHLFGTISTLHSDDSVNSVSGNVGIRVDF